MLYTRLGFNKEYVRTCDTEINSCSLSKSIQPSATSSYDASSFTFFFSSFLVRKKINKKVSIPLLPVPLLRSRLLETLGAVTMCCFIDDDIICEGYSGKLIIIVLYINLFLHLCIYVHLNSKQFSYLY